MTSVASREATTTAEQTEGGGACVSPAPANGGTPMVPPTDVCEAFWCVSCVLWFPQNNSCPFVSIRGSLSAFGFKLREAVTPIYAAFIRYSNVV